MTTLRGLSLTQPWASLVALGAKRYETRSWKTTYRGWLAIHASAAYPRWARELERAWAFSQALAVAWRPLPTGAVIAIARLADCFECREDTALTLGHPEATFGDFSAGRHYFRLEDVRPLRRPLKFKGKLGLWSVPADDTSRILELVT